MSSPPPYGPPPPPPPPRVPPEGWPGPDRYQPSYGPHQQHYEPVEGAGPSGRRFSRRGGLFGGLLAFLLAIWSFGKWLLVFPAFKTLLTMAVSFGAYAIFIGPWAAAGLVVMILVHELGHVLEIRRQGMQASAPLFIPFLGAAIFQREHPQDALRQAQIGIAGPIAGTIGATVAFVLYSVTDSAVLLFFAYLGFFINLFNLIPAGMLDGGWIMGAVSKWFQAVGITLLVLSVFLIGFSPIVLIVGLLGIPTVIERFRNDHLPYYRSVSPAARWAMGTAWLLLTVYLSFAFFETHRLLDVVVR